MKLEPKPGTSEHIRAALAALYGPPMTDAERREFDRLRAREMHRAEARRRKSPQLELDE